MTVHAHLTARGFEAAPPRTRTAAERLLDEIAQHAVQSGDAERLLRTTAHQLRFDKSGLTLRLNEPVAGNAAVAVARRLRNIGVFAVYNVAGERNKLFARLASDVSSADARRAVARLMDAGRWLELGAAEKLRSVGRERHVEIDVAAQLKITTPNGATRELDVATIVNGELLLLECKAGSVDGAQVARFAATAELLGVPTERALLLAPSIDAADAADMATFHPVTIVDRPMFLSLVDELLTPRPCAADPAATESSPSPTSPSPMSPSPMSPGIPVARPRAVAPSAVAPLRVVPALDDAAPARGDGGALRRLFGRR